MNKLIEFLVEQLKFSIVMKIIDLVFYDSTNKEIMHYIFGVICGVFMMDILNNVVV